MAHRHNHVNEKKQWEKERAENAKIIEELKRTLQNITDEKAELQKKFDSLNSIFEALATTHDTMATEKKKVENDRKQLKEAMEMLLIELKSSHSFIHKIHDLAQDLIQGDPTKQLIGAEMLKLFQEERDSAAETVQTLSDSAENAGIPEPNIRISLNIPMDGRLSPETVEKHLEIVEKAQKMAENGDRLSENRLKLVEGKQQLEKMTIDGLKSAENSVATAKNEPPKPAPKSKESSGNAPELKNQIKSTENAPNPAENAPGPRFLARNLNRRKTDRKKMIQLEPYREPEEQAENGGNLTENGLNSDPQAQNAPILAENGLNLNPEAEDLSDSAENEIYEALELPEPEYAWVHNETPEELKSILEAITADFPSKLAENAQKSSLKGSGAQDSSKMAQNALTLSENGIKSAQHVPNYAEIGLEVVQDALKSLKLEREAENLSRSAENGSRAQNAPNAVENGSKSGSEVKNLSKLAENGSGAQNAPKLVENGSKSGLEAKNAQKTAPATPKASGARNAQKAAQNHPNPPKSTENAPKAAPSAPEAPGSQNAPILAKNGSKLASAASTLAPDAKNSSKSTENAPKSAPAASEGPEAQNGPILAENGSKLDPAAPEPQNDPSFSENGSKSTENAPNPSSSVPSVSKILENTQRLVQIALETRHYPSITPVVIADEGDSNTVTDEQLLAGLAKIVAQNRAPRTQKAPTPPPDLEIDSEEEREFAEVLPVLREYGLEWFQDVHHPTGEDLERLLTTVIQVNRLQIADKGKKEPKPTRTPEERAKMRQLLREDWEAEFGTLDSSGSELDFSGETDSDDDPEHSESDVNAFGLTTKARSKSGNDAPRSTPEPPELAKNAPGPSELAPEASEASGSSEEAPGAPGPSEAAPEAPGPLESAPEAPGSSDMAPEAPGPSGAASEPQNCFEFAPELLELVKSPTKFETSVEWIRYFEDKRQKAIAEREAAGLPPRPPITDAPWERILADNPRPPCSHCASCSSQPTPPPRNGSTGRRHAPNPLDAILDNPGPTRRSPGPSRSASQAKNAPKSAPGPSGPAPDASGPKNQPKSAPGPPDPIEAYVISDNTHYGFKLPLESAISVQKMVETIENGRKPSPNPEILKGFDKIKRELLALLKSHENELISSQSAKQTLILVKNPSKPGENGENFAKLTQNSAKNPAKWGQNSQKIDGYEVKEEKNGKTVKMRTMDAFSATLALKDAKESIERRENWAAVKPQKTQSKCPNGCSGMIPDWLLPARDAQGTSNPMTENLKAAFEADVEKMSAKFAKGVMEREKELEKEKERRFQKAKMDLVGIFRPRGRGDGPSTSSAAPRNIDEWEKKYKDKLKFDPSKYRDDKDNEKLFDECFGRFFNKVPSAPKKDNVALGLGSSKDYNLEEDKEDEEKGPGPSGSA